MSYHICENCVHSTSTLTPRDFIKNTKMSPNFFKWILTGFRLAFIYTNPYITLKIKLQIFQIRQNIFNLRYHGNENVLKTVCFCVFFVIYYVFLHILAQFTCNIVF